MIKIFRNIFLIVSLVTVPIFIFSINYLTTIGDNDNKNTTLIINSIDPLLSNNIDKSRKILSHCNKEKQLDPALLISECLMLGENSMTANKDKVLKDRSGQWLIYITYLFLWSSFNVQISILVFVRFKEVDNKEMLFYVSDWAINSAPMLGVLGTIISFSLLIAHSESTDMSKIFSKYFISAAATTIIGGFVYVINLAVAAIINTKLSLH